MTVCKKKLSSRCNLTAQIEPVQDRSKPKCNEIFIFSEITFVDEGKLF